MSIELPLTINGRPPQDVIKEAYDLGVKLDGPGCYDLDDPVQTELRRIRDWITMAESDVLASREPV